MSTATVERSLLAGREFADFARRYIEAARAKDDYSLAELATYLNSVVFSAIHEDDVDSMSGLRSRISRLRRNVANADGASDAVLPLTVMINTLEIREAITLAAKESDARRAEARTLRDKVLEVVTAGEGQPTSIAKQLDIDPVQVSRTLRLLVEEELVESVAPPREITTDKRIRWYRLAAERAMDRKIEVDDSHGEFVMRIRGGLKLIAVLDEDDELEVVDRSGRAATEPDLRRLADALPH